MLALVPSLLLFVTPTGEPQPGGSEAGCAREPVAVAWPMVPALPCELALIENRGQWPSWVRFAGRLGGAIVRLEEDGIGIELRERGDPCRGALARVSFDGAGGPARWEAEEPREVLYSFFLGNDPERWVRGARGFGRVVWRELHPGIDLVVGRGEGGLKYDLLVRPGAELEAVRLRLEGVQDLREGEGGLLHGDLDGTGFVQLPGRSWEVLPDGRTREVRCTWRAEADGTFVPRVEGRDPDHALVIDPELAWSTYLGGSDADAARALAGNAKGELVIHGGTLSTDFPRTPGAFQSPQGPLNLFAAKLREADGRLVYSCVFGGGPVNSTQVATGAALDEEGRATLVGTTTAGNFPTTPGSFQPRKQSASNKEAGFVLQLAPQGDDVLFGTFLEGPQQGSLLECVAVDSDGVVVGGAAKGPDFPVTPGAYQTSYQGAIAIGDAFVSRLDPTGSTLVWSTLLGASDTDGAKALTLGAGGEVFVAGRTASHDFPTTPGAFQESIPPGAWITTFVSKLSAQGDALVWSSYLCGSTKDGEQDLPVGLAIDAFESVYVSGGTTSPGFPTTPGTYKSTFPPGASIQGFTTRFQPDGRAIAWSTLTGGNLTGGGSFVAVDPSGVVTLLGGLQEQLPLTPGSFDTSFNGNQDGALFRLSPAGDRLFYGSYLGGPAHDVLVGGLHLSSTGRVSVAGWVSSPGGWPITAGALQPSFHGGSSDSVMASLDLLLEGLSLAGTSQPSCLGPLQINATRMPSAGAAGFALWCSAAPPLAQGWLLLGTALAAPSSVGGIPLWISPSGPLARIPVAADAHGYAEVALPLTSATAGDQLAAQFLFRSTTCQGHGPWSSSPLLRIEVQ